MKPRLRTAIELLLSHPDAVVAEMIGVRVATLHAWMSEESFRKALREREREQAASARRLAKQSIVNSAARLCQIASDPSKSDAKVLVDLLKASGAFDAPDEDPGAGLAEVLRRIEHEEEEANAAGS